MSSTDLQALANVNSLRNSIDSWKRLLCHLMKTSSWKMSISILAVKIAGPIISTQFCQILVLSTYFNTYTIHGHILYVLCTSKSLTSPVCDYVKDGISNHVAVFFTIAYLPYRTLTSFLEPNYPCLDISALEDIYINFDILLTCLLTYLFVASDIVVTLIQYHLFVCVPIKYYTAKSIAI